MPSRNTGVSIEAFGSGNAGSALTSERKAEPDSIARRTSAARSCSRGESKGADDLAQAVRTAVINKRAGGTGLIVGRKAFQRPMADGVELLHAVQDVFLDGSVTIA